MGSGPVSNQGVGSGVKQSNGSSSTGSGSGEEAAGEAGAGTGISVLRAISSVGDAPVLGGQPGEGAWQPPAGEEAAEGGRLFKQRAPAGAAGGISGIRGVALGKGQLQEAGEEAEPECAACSALPGKTTTLTLHWLSAPRTVLVVCKLSPSVYGWLNQTLRWLRWVDDWRGWV